jgi:transcription-repair coupling factor (superfamily II helicase)
MYCQLLAEAARRLKGQTAEPVPTAVVDLGLATYIPKNYIPFDRGRLDIYRRIAVARSVDGLKQLESELSDVYGQVPEEVRLLLDLAELRIKADKCGIKRIVTSGEDLIFSFAKDSKGKAEYLFAGVSGKVRFAGPETMYLRLGKNYFEPKTLIGVLRKILSRALQDSV